MNSTSKGKIVARARRANRSERNGSVLIAALVCMTVALVILLATMRSSNRQRMQLRHELQMEQVRWLLDGGVSRALVEFKKSKKYTGETILVGPVLDEKSKATIEIIVNRSSNEKADGSTEDEKVTIDVVAKIERGQQSMQRTKRVKLNEK